MKTLTVVVLALILVGCGSAIPARNYCDTEVSHDLWKQESGYRLYLRIGKVSERSCRIVPDNPREINLSQNVSSIEEADKLIEFHRQKFVERNLAKPALAQAAKP